MLSLPCGSQEQKLGRACRRKGRKSAVGTRLSSDSRPRGRASGGNSRALGGDHQLYHIEPNGLGTYSFLNSS